MPKTKQNRVSTLPIKKAKRKVLRYVYWYEIGWAWRDGEGTRLYEPGLEWNTFIRMRNYADR